MLLLLCLMIMIQWNGLVLWWRTIDGPFRAFFFVCVFSVVFSSVPGAHFLVHASKTKMVMYVVFIVLATKARRRRWWCTLLLLLLLLLPRRFLLITRDTNNQTHDGIAQTSSSLFVLWCISVHCWFHRFRAYFLFVRTHLYKTKSGMTYFEVFMYVRIILPPSLGSTTINNYVYCNKIVVERTRLHLKVRHMNIIDISNRKRPAWFSWRTHWPQIKAVTGDHCNQDRSHTQKPIYFSIFTTHIWTWLLCPPVLF